MYTMYIYFSNFISQKMSCREKNDRPGELGRNSCSGARSASLLELWSTEPVPVLTFANRVLVRENLGKHICNTRIEL